MNFVIYYELGGHKMIVENYLSYHQAEQLVDYYNALSQFKGYKIGRKK